MYICADCKKLYETLPGDYECNCGGVVDDASECKICGSHYYYYDGFGYCPECLDKHATFETAVEMGNAHKETIKVNSLITHMYTEDEIEKILLNYARTHQDREENAKTYCLYDIAYFSTYLDDKCK